MKYLMDYILLTKRKDGRLLKNIEVDITQLYNVIDVTCLYKLNPSFMENISESVLKSWDFLHLHIKKVQSFATFNRIVNLWDVINTY